VDTSGDRNGQHIAGAELVEQSGFARQFNHDKIGVLGHACQHARRTAVNRIGDGIAVAGAELEFL
jgi:hypothetical protein